MKRKFVKHPQSVTASEETKDGLYVMSLTEYMEIQGLEESDIPDVLGFPASDVSRIYEDASGEGVYVGLAVFDSNSIGSRSLDYYVVGMGLRSPKKVTFKELKNMVLSLGDY